MTLIKTILPNYLLDKENGALINTQDDSAVKASRKRYKEFSHLVNRINKIEKALIKAGINIE
jgi:hypothetical protein